MKAKDKPIEYWAGRLLGDPQAWEIANEIEEYGKQVTKEAIDKFNIKMDVEKTGRKEARYKIAETIKSEL